ncbi:Alpha/Beta hydrolase protein, partial [Mucidula mucida]
MRRLVEYWKNGFDWRAQEAAINAELPQFTRDIKVDGFGTLNIHYVHQKSKAFDAIPLSFVLGWPSSFLEVRKMLPLLTVGNPSLHVVALSLLGFGFSEAPSKKGFRVNRYAEVAHKVMMALGYSEYVTHGGDLGTVITRAMALKYGTKHVKAWHTTFPYGFPPPPYRPSLLNTCYPYTLPKAGRKRPNGSKSRNGYCLQQSTRPQTLGYSLADSPVGCWPGSTRTLAWTDEYPWTDDEVLTWISYTLFSSGPTASTRIYYETYQAEIATRSSTRPPSRMGSRSSLDMVFVRFRGSRRTGISFSA